MQEWSPWEVHVEGGWEKKDKSHGKRKNKKERLARRTMRTHLQWTRATDRGPKENGRERCRGAGVGGNFPHD